MLSKNYMLNRDISVLNVSSMRIFEARAKEKRFRKNSYKRVAIFCNKTLADQQDNFRPKCSSSDLLLKLSDEKSFDTV